jgi:hypothetical protein
MYHLASKEKTVLNVHSEGTIFFIVMMCYYKTLVR